MTNDAKKRENCISISKRCTLSFYPTYIGDSILTHMHCETRQSLTRIISCTTIHIKYAKKMLSY